MDTDNRMIELLAEMLHEQREMRQQMFQILVEQREMRKDIQEMRKEQTRMNEELREVRDEQRRTTSAIWELTQIMQKIVIEPAAHQGREIAMLKGKVATIESHLGLS
jgi:uncharacterized coiled-coil DUF342 family protein